MVQTQEKRRKNPRIELMNTKANVIMNVGGAIYRTERQDEKVKNKMSCQAWPGHEWPSQTVSQHHLLAKHELAMGGQVKHYRVTATNQS